MIRCAAVKVFCPDGEHIIQCHRHHHAFEFLSEFSVAYDKARTEQGFTTTDNRFLDRRDAYMEAQRCGQIQRVAGGYEGDQLFSEDLY